MASIGGPWWSSKYSLRSQAHVLGMQAATLPALSRKPSREPIWVVRARLWARTCAAEDALLDSDGPRGDLESSPPRPSS